MSKFVKISVLVIAILALVFAVIKWRSGALQQTPTGDQSNVSLKNEANDIIDKAVITDTDLDGLKNEEEIALKTDPKNDDTDGDGVNDYYEVKFFGSDPLNKDTLKNGKGDAWSVQNGLLKRKN